MVYYGGPVFGSREYIFQAKSLCEGYLAVIVEIGTQQTLQLKVRLQLQGLMARKAVARRKGLIEGEEIVEAHTQRHGYPLKTTGYGY